MSSVILKSCVLKHRLPQSINFGQLHRFFAQSASNNMRFVQYKLNTGGPQQLGVQLEEFDDIFAISAIESTIPNSLRKALETGTRIVEKARRIVAAGKSVIPYKDVTFMAPITGPDKVACVGLNYKGHCDEQNIPHPKEPMFFSKFSSTIVGPFDNIHLPQISDKVDWEVELAVVIGKKAKAIREDQVQEHIFGYTIAQDISARDWQKERNMKQFLLGKSMDTFCPLGPAIIPKEFVKDPQNLTMCSWLNGDLMQEGNTSDMVFHIDFLVAYLSQVMTLYPGDVLLTGTPSGVGMHRDPPMYMKKGDVLESEIATLGKMRNVCV